MAASSSSGPSREFQDFAAFMSDIRPNQIVIVGQQGNLTAVTPEQAGLAEKAKRTFGSLGRMLSVPRNRQLHQSISNAQREVATAIQNSRKDDGTTLYDKMHQLGALRRGLATMVVGLKTLQQSYGRLEDHNSESGVTDRISELEDQIKELTRNINILHEQNAPRMVLSGNLRDPANPQEVKRSMHEMLLVRWGLSMDWIPQGTKIKPEVRDYQDAKKTVAMLDQWAHERIGRSLNTLRDKPLTLDEAEKLCADMHIACPENRIFALSELLCDRYESIHREARAIAQEFAHPVEKGKSIDAEALKEGIYAFLRQTSNISMDFMGGSSSKLGDYHTALLALDVLDKAAIRAIGRPFSSISEEQPLTVEEAKALCFVLGIQCPQNVERVHLLSHVLALRYQRIKDEMDQIRQRLPSG